MNLKIVKESQFKDVGSQIDNQENAQKVIEIFSREDVCQILSISLRTEQSYRDQRRISFSQSGRKIFYQESDIKDFLERHHIKASYGQKGDTA